MRVFDIVRKENWNEGRLKSKLTIAVDRITLKIPSNCNDYVKNKLVNFAKEVADKIDFDFTVRGEINFHNETGLWTTLYTQNRRTREKTAQFKFQQYEDQ
jgi:hypothetical protein